MTNPEFWLCDFHLDGRRLHVIWHTNDKDELVVLSNGKIASFADESELRAFCGSKGMPLMPKRRPEVYDFDAIDAWCHHPAAESVDPELFLNAWNMLEDALGFRLDFQTVPSLQDETSGKVRKIYD